jgi:DNA polymerase III delta subunit
MHYLLLGNDTSLKDTQLNKIKRELFSDTDSQRMDSETLDGHKLSPEKLKIALLSLPALAEKRFVHIRQAEKLSKENLALLEDFLKGDSSHVVVVLDAVSWEAKSEARKSILHAVRTIGREEAAGANVFDMMDLVGRGDTARALKVLKGLFDRDEEPERVLGGMIWAWSNKIKPRTQSPKYKKGLLILQEADHQLKRVRFPDRGYALEIALVKLSYLLRA